MNIDSFETLMTSVKERELNSKCHNWIGDEEKKGQNQNWKLEPISVDESIIGFNVPSLSFDVSVFFLFFMLWAWTSQANERKLKSWLTHWHLFALTNMYKQFNFLNAFITNLALRWSDRGLKCWRRNDLNVQIIYLIEILKWFIHKSSSKDYYFISFSSLHNAVVHVLLYFAPKASSQEGNEQHKEPWKMLKSRKRDLNIFKCHIHVILSI